MNNKAYILSIMVIILFVTALLAAAPLRDDEVEITVNLRLRASGGQDAGVIKVLNKGELAQVIETGRKTERINGIEAKWYKVETEGIEGWVFGGYIRKTGRMLVKMNPGYTAWFERPGNDHEKKIFCLRYAGKSKIIKILISPDIDDYEVSPNGKYAAFDSGTDIIGRIDIYEIETKKPVYNAPYSPRVLVWKNNTISIHRVTGTNFCYLVWELDFFNNGKIKKNIKSGKGEYHCE